MLDKREGNIAFSKPKAVRLAFHDCMPYEDGTGGCDGCLSFEENEHEHNVLQHTVAILVCLDSEYVETWHSVEITGFFYPSGFTSNQNWWI